MRWRTGRRSDNVEDRRGRSPGRMPMRVGRKGGMSIGSLLVVAAVMYFLGIDPTVLLTGGLPVDTGQSGTTLNTGVPGGGARDAAGPPADDEQAQFVSVVLADTEDTWNALLPALGYRYEEPNLVLFSGLVQSACGLAQAAMGPFYCPGDRKVYIDLSFYDELQHRFGASGDFAQAYVIAHEVGHHVQTLLGISEEVARAGRRLDESGRNQLSVMQELQADCLAGLWAHHADKARNIIEAGDIEEALTAAAAIGDDRLQKQSQGYVVPDAFTHGSSEQRVRWFKRGLREGRFDACDTFAADAL